MMKGKVVYRRTHRMLLKSTEEDFKYHTVEIDINSGLFKKAIVASKDTKIRVNNEVYGEAFTLAGSKGLTPEEIADVEVLFNEARKENGWTTVSFRTTKESQDDVKEVSSTSEVQG